jgi:sulfatase modifying factor 1
MVTGGAFNRNSDSSLPATISNFKLDNYEITVGRFRKFVDAGQGTQIGAPITGKGAHPNLAGSGWTAGYNAPLSADKATLLANLKTISNPAGPSSVCLWTDAPGAYENYPMNCINWLEAFAFCVWDGGYLPTEAEWNYAAMGGSNYWTFPWGTTAPDSTLAVFGQTAPPPGTVGSKAAGNGRYGQSDLAGNVWEWYLDAYTTTPPVPCTDCAVIDPNNTSRGVRGGGFASAAASLRALDPSPYAYPYDYRAYGIGARCARRL